MTAACNASRRTGQGAEHDVFGALDIGTRHRQHLVHDPEQRVERRLNALASVDGDIAMQDFLQDLGARHETFLSDDRRFQHPLRVCLVRMGEVHGNVGVDEDHRESSSW